MAAASISISLQKLAPEWLDEQDLDDECMKRVIRCFQRSKTEIVLHLHNLDTPVTYTGNIDGYQGNPIESLIGCAAESALKHLYRQGMNDKEIVKLQFLIGKQLSRPSHISLTESATQKLLSGHCGSSEEQGTIAYAHANIEQKTLHIHFNRNPEKAEKIFRGLFKEGT